MRFLRFAAAFTLVAFAIALRAVAGEVYGHGPILGTVTAVSMYGNGSIRAPYRNTPVGYQVRLPHGTWVYCPTNCSETLRVQTVVRAREPDERLRHAAARVRYPWLPPQVVHVAILTSGRPKR